LLAAWTELLICKQWFWLVISASLNLQQIATNMKSTHVGLFSMEGS